MADDHISHPVGRRSGRRKQEVLAVACRVIADRGADATRFADVATASGVGVSTLQYYFGNREDMLVAAFRFAAARDIEKLRTDLDGITDPWEQLLHIATVLMGEASEATVGGAPDPDYSWRLWVESWRWALRDVEVRTDVLRDYTTWREMIAITLNRGIAAGTFRSDLDPRVTATQVLALIDGLALPVALGDPAISLEDAQAALEVALRRLTS